ncbi:AlkZ-related protein [Eisenbergiella sp.]
MKLPVIHTAEQLVDLVNEIGFLPFFQNSISGYSVEDCTPPELMFVKGTEGPWEWREEMLERRSCVYGKFFAGRTGLVSLEWFPHLANYRRGGYDFDARWEDGLVNYREKHIYDLVEKVGPCPSPELRRLAGVTKGKGSAFEGTVGRLQMRTYLLPVKCIFARNRQGEKYGYGMAYFDLAERWLGEERCRLEYDTSPADSYSKILSHLKRKLDSKADMQLEKLIRMP